jgi:hypothetical protein
VVDPERGTVQTVAYYRTLDEDATVRHYFRHHDEEGGLPYIEAVPDRGELIVVRQAELMSAGQLHRYDWAAGHRRPANSAGSGADVIITDIGTCPPRHHGMSTACPDQAGPPGSTSSAGPRRACTRSTHPLTR